MLYVADDRRLSASSMLVAASALWFLYTVRSSGELGGPSWNMSVWCPPSRIVIATSRKS